MKAMSENEINRGLRKGYSQCIVEAQSDGTLCWDESESRDREPIHSVKKGERFWCWNFKEAPNGYTHDYANMAPTNVRVDTDVILKLVYITDNGDDPNLYETVLAKSPNIS